MACSGTALLFFFTQTSLKLLRTEHMFSKYKAGGSLGLFFFFPEGGVGQNHAWMPACLLAYYAFPRWFELGQRRWNGQGETEKFGGGGETFPSATLSIINPSRIDMGMNPCLYRERPATNYMNHSTALCGSHIVIPSNVNPADSKTSVTTYDYTASKRQLQHGYKECICLRQ
jgi:hypothetical protein